MDQITRLAEVLGAPAGASLDDTLRNLDRALPAPIVFPSPLPGESGPQTERGIATERAIMGVYYANALMKVARLIFGGRVLEIGDSGTAFFARLFGLTDYTIIARPADGYGGADFDIVLNVDSMADMAPELIETNLQFIRKSKAFLCIRPEAKKVTDDPAAMACPTHKRMRPDHVEELFLYVSLPARHMFDRPRL